MEQRCVILELIVILVIGNRALIVTTAPKRSAHVDRRIGADRVLNVPLAQVLKTRLVDDLRSVDLGIADLECVLVGGFVVALGWKRELADSVVSLRIPK